MLDDLPGILRCPRCGAPMKCQGPVQRDDVEVRAGTLACDGPDGHAFEVRDGIVRLGAGMADPIVKSELEYERNTYVGDPRLVDPEIIAGFPERLVELWPNNREFAGDFRDLVRHLKLGTGTRTLDVGTGACWSSRLLAEAGGQVVALDVNDHAFCGLGAADIQMRAHGVRFDRVLESMTRLPFANGTFDQVVFNASLHHTPDLAVTLRECRRVLRAGGLVALANEEFSSLRQWIQPQPSAEAGSHHDIDAWAFHRAVRKAGFRISYHVVTHVRRALERRLGGTVSSVATALLEAFPPLHWQLNSKVIVLRPE